MEAIAMRIHVKPDDKNIWCPAYVYIFARTYYGSRKRKFGKLFGQAAASAAAVRFCKANPLHGRMARMRKCRGSLNSGSMLRVVAPRYKSTLQPA